VSVDVKVTVLVGGVGGARFLLGVQHLLGLGQFSSYSDGSQSDNDLTAVVNIGDDAWMYGVRICPDLDTCMYTLGGAIDPERGWGHRNETWHAKEELAAYGVIAMKPGTPKRNSPPTGCNRTGSALATAISPPTWSAARCCARAIRCRR